MDRKDFRTAKAGQAWKDEMLMYDASTRDLKRMKRRQELDEMKKEFKKLKMEKEKERLHMREERKLFIGGLSPETIEKDLHVYFSQFGQLIDARVMRDRQSGVSRGFAFITFACSFMVDAVLDHLEPHKINGKVIQTKKAISNKPSTANQQKQSLLYDLESKRSIFVGSLKEDTTENDLVQYFSTFGTVIRAVIIKDKATQHKKMFGFVDFKQLGVVGKILNVNRHFIGGKRIRVDLSRPRIEFSHQTKTIFVGGLEDGIDDPELRKYFSEFGFVTRALRIPNKDLAKRKFGFVDFDDFDAVDIVVSQREHFIGGHRVRVELALPITNDSLYEKDVFFENVIQDESWMDKVKRKLQFAIPDSGTWGEKTNNYEIFVQGGADIKTVQFKIQRAMLEYTVGMAGKIVGEIANDTHTRITVKKPAIGSKVAIIMITGKTSDVQEAQYIFQQIVKSNLNKMNVVKL